MSELQSSRCGIRNENTDIGFPKETNEYIACDRMILVVFIAEFKQYLVNVVRNNRQPTLKGNQMFDKYV